VTKVLECLWVRLRDAGRLLDAMARALPPPSASQAAGARERGPSPHPLPLVLEHSGLGRSHASGGWAPLQGALRA